MVRKSPFYRRDPIRGQFRSNYHAEVLEARRLLASMTYVVSSLSDNGPGTLRQAILDANANPGFDSINLEIFLTNKTIRLATPLPTIDSPVLIDGRTEVGYNREDPTSMATIDGSLAGPNANGFEITAGGAGSTIRGLAVVRFSGDAIRISGGNNNTIVGNDIGTLGRAGLGNGIAVLNSSGNSIGGSTSLDRNVIEGFGDQLSFLPFYTSVNPRPLGVATGDFNGDGNADVAVNGIDSPGVQILWGTVNGSLAAGSTIPLGSVVQATATASLTASGRADIVTVNQGNGSDPDSVNVLLGQSDGTFQVLAPILLNGQDTRSVVIGDFNGDGKLDIALTAEDQSVVDVLLGDGTGHFGPAIETAVPPVDLDEFGDSSLPINLAVGDFNSDGKADLAVGNFNDNSIRILISRGDGTFLVGGATVLVNSPTGLVTGKFTGGTGIDVAAVTGNLDGVQLFAVSTDGLTVTPAGVLDANSAPTAITTGDFDGNHNLDIATVTGDQDRILVNNGDGTFQPPQVATLPPRSFGNALAAIDFNNDGRPDLVTSLQSANQVAVLLVAPSNKNGILISGPGSTGNLVTGNDIGVNSVTQEIGGNGGFGILLDNGATNNSIGGLLSTLKNVISENFAGGIAFEHGSSANLFIGNVVGTDKTGRLALPNQGPGVSIVGASNNTIGGLIAGARNLISGNDGPGVLISQGAGFNLIEGNVIGLAVDSLSIIANGSAGVQISDSSFNTVGGTSIGAGNTIAGNGGDGVGIAGATAIGNTLLGNLIGVAFVNQTTIKLRNSGNGVNVQSAVGTVIGGANLVGPDGSTTLQGGNVISGNQLDGILLSSVGEPGTLIKGNRIGLDVSGALAVGNLGNGITLQDSVGVVVGSTLADQNVVSGNEGSGLAIFGSSSANSVGFNKFGTNIQGTLAIKNAKDGITIAPSASVSDLTGPAQPMNNTISNNLISGNGSEGILIRGLRTMGTLVTGNNVGADLTGLISLGNAGDGIEILGSSGNTISGNASSGNRQNGIVIDGSIAGNLIAANRIGLGADQVSAIRNGLNGILLRNGSANNSIGGASLALRNIISGNIGNGIRIESGSSLNLIQGNIIGLGADGQTPDGNLLAGVSIVSASNLVGGAGLAANLISENLGNGVEIVGSIASTNIIATNRIGTDATGLIAHGNKGYGVLIQDASSSTISGNLISANILGGLRIANSPLSPDPAGRNQVIGNLIGTDATGFVALGNNGVGILVDGSHDNTIGGTSDAARNVISANVLTGILIQGSRASGNLITGDTIGLTRDGQSPLGNGREGILLLNGASGNTIGGAGVGARNVISANSTHGIELAGLSAGNFVLGNFIGTSVDGQRKGLGNVLNGLFLNQASQNFVGQAGAGNTIVDNGLSGINIDASANNVVDANLIEANLIQGNRQDGIFLNGSGANQIGGLDLAQANTITGNAQSGIHLFSTPANGNLILRNYIGTDPAGHSGLGNAQQGIFLDMSPDTTINGNVISGNLSSGIYLLGANTTGTLIVANLIGTDATGTRAIGNNQDGITIVDASANKVGDATLAFGRNLISGNGTNGIQILNPGSFGNVIAGNFVGVNAGGTAALKNQIDGVLINNAPSNTVGGLGILALNLISGNGEDGVHVLGLASQNNHVLGNAIGVDSTATASLGNQRDGVRIEDASSNTIGTANLVTADGFVSVLLSNLISGNASNGVEILGSDASGNQVIGNRIGTDGSGTVAVPNIQGLFIQDSPANTIGSSDPGTGNLISGNVNAGIQVVGQNATGNAIVGNLIGTNGAGSSSLSNAYGVILNGVTGNLVGGTTAASRNLISGNASIGVYLVGSVGTNSAGNIIEGNFIGPDITGTRAITIGVNNVSQMIGIQINDANSNVIGGLAPEAGNLISGNVAGLSIAGSLATGNVLVQNRIGTDVSGSNALGNLVGIYLNGVASNIIGLPGAGNIISGNTSVGLSLFGVLTTGNIIQANFIGTDAPGTKALANPTGIYLENSPKNLIGGASSLLGNTISGNSSVGIYIFGSQSTGNSIFANQIGTTTRGKQKIGNGLYGVLLYNAPNNPISRSGKTANVFAGNKIANVREFTGATPRGPAKAARKVK